MMSTKKRVLLQIQSFDFILLLTVMILYALSDLRT